MIDERVTAYLERFLPDSENEWRRRMEALFARLADDITPCSGVLMLRTDRGVRCCVGGVMTLAANDAIPFGRWYGAEKYHPGSSPNLLADDEAAQTWRFHPAGRPAHVANSSDERLTHHSCDVPPEALLYHGVNVQPGISHSPIDDLTDGALRQRLPAPDIKEDWTDLGKVNDDLMRQGLNPLDELAAAMEQGMERMSDTFWHPAVNKWQGAGC